MPSWQTLPLWSWLQTWKQPQPTMGSVTTLSGVGPATSAICQVKWQESCPSLLLVMGPLTLVLGMYPEADYDPA